MADNKRTPAYVQDMIVQELIDRLIPPDLDKDKYSLDQPLYSENRNLKDIEEPRPARKLKSASRPSKPAYTYSKPALKLKSALESLVIKEGLERKAKMIGEKYVAGIFETYGAETAIMQDGFGYNLLVLSRDKSELGRFNIIVDQMPHSAIIEFETYRIENNEVISDINTELADGYIFVICGTPGFFHIDTKALRLLIESNNVHESFVKLKDGYFNKCGIDRNLLLNNLKYLNYQK